MVQSMKSSVRILGGTISVGLILQFTLGTSPALPPYHQYLVSGRISRPVGRPLQEFVVTLKAKFSNLSLNFLPVSEYRTRSDLDTYPAVTDTSGHFFLIVATALKADSLKIEVGGADKPVVAGPAIPVPSQAISLTTEYADTQPECSGCTTETSHRTRTYGYQYNLPEQTISLSF